MTGQRREPPPVSALTTRALRDVMGRFATGVTVLTAHGEKAHGMTANAIRAAAGLDKVQGRGPAGDGLSPEMVHWGRRQ